MALTQIQIIQSLGEALTWFEKELAWGVDPAELRHLTGRIGELYAAMITRGQMAHDTNQRGYDVISAENERVSVKTVTSSNHVSFRASTFEAVDRIIVLRLNVDPEEGVSIESLLDKPVDEAMADLAIKPDGWRYIIPVKRKEVRPLENLGVDAEVRHGDFVIRQYENGTIEVLRNGEALSPTKPHLRDIARSIGFPIEWDNGRQKNTRQIGAGIIRQVEQERVQRSALDALDKFLSDEK